MSSPRAQRWIAAGGAFLVSLDATVNIAFPAIASAFEVAPEQMRWVIICYVFTYAVMSFVGGALADALGHARVFRAGVALSTLGFLVVGMAATFPLLLVGRVVQGFAGGLVYGTAPGIMTLASPPEARGRALGFLNAAIGVAFTLGPLVAGVLVEAFGWPSIFHVRVPLALAVLAWALTLPPARADGVHQMVRAADVLCLPVLRAGFLAFVANAGIFAIWLLAPFYLIGVRGLGTAASGGVFMLCSCGLTVVAPLTGRVVDRLGPAVPVTVGLALEAVGLWALSRADATTPVVVLALALFASGAGLGVFQVPYMTMVMAAFPAGQQGAAGGFAFLARTLGVVAGTLTLAHIFAVRRDVAGAQTAFQEAFLAAALGVALAALLAMVPTRRRPT